jgi:hypothetical protein
MLDFYSEAKCIENFLPAQNLIFCYNLKLGQKDAVPLCASIIKNSGVAA